MWCWKIADSDDVSGAAPTVKINGAGTNHIFAVMHAIDGDFDDVNPIADFASQGIAANNAYGGGSVTAGRDNSVCVMAAIIPSLGTAGETEDTNHTELYDQIDGGSAPWFGMSYETNIDSTTENPQYASSGLPKVAMTIMIQPKLAAGGGGVNTALLAAAAQLI